MSGNLYTEHFGLKERPFSLSPDPDFMFWSKSHTRAFSVLEYGIMTHAPLTVVTGEVGAGKTTLVQALLAQLEGELTVGLISNAKGDRGDLLRWVLNSFAINVDQNSDYVSLFQTFQDFVLAEYAAGRHVVLIIDEAQNLGAETLEELRMFTNVNSGKDALLQIVLVGQPELREIIQRPSLRQFAQRVTATYHLQPLDLPTMRDYIRHRLQHAGGTGDEFTAPAMREIYDQSGGIPRIVNNLCDLSLVYAASAGEKQVNVATVNEIIRDGLILRVNNDPLYLTDPTHIPNRAAE